MSTMDKSNLINVDEISLSTIVTESQTQAPLQPTTNGATPLSPQEVQTAYVQWLPPAPIGMHYVLLPIDQSANSTQSNTNFDVNKCYLCNAIADQRCMWRQGCTRLMCVLHSERAMVPPYQPLCPDHKRQHDRQSCSIL